MCPSGLPAGSSSVKFVTGGTEWVTPEGKNVLVKQSTFLPCEKTKESSKDTFQTPPVVSPGGIAPIQGPFDGDSSDSSVKIAGKDAKIVAQSRDVSFADIPVETPAGRNEMVVTDGDKGATIPVCVLNVSVSADDLTLRSGQKTKAHVGLNGPEQCPDSVWAHAGVPGDLVDVGKLMPDFRVPGKEDEGKILLKIVSSGSIKMKDAKNNTILKWLSQADFEKGPYKTDLDLQGTAVGGFGIVVTAYPFLAPIEGEPFDVPPEKQAESGGEQTPAQTDKFISQLRDLAERARDAAEATEDQARKEELEDLARDFEEIADALEETPDTSEQVSGGPDNWRKLAKVYRKQAEQARQNALVAKDPASKKFWEEKAAGDEKEAKLNEDRATSAEQEAKQDDQMETRGGKDTDLNANGFPKAPTEGTVKTPPKPATPKPNCDEVCGDEKREADRANKAELAIYESLKPAEKQMEEARKKLKQAEKFWLALEDNYSVVPFVGPSTADIENAAHAYAAAQGVFDAAAKNYKYWAGKMGTAIQECIRAREKYHECLRSKGCPVPTGTSC